MENKIEKLNITSPSEMIKIAITGGADLDKLEKLLALQERWEANEAKKAYHESMALFKANPPKIDKDKTVAYGNTKYNHATLANVTEKISTELSKHGLSASWSTKQNGTISVTCRITHVKGHSEETTISAAADTSGSKNSIQAIGSTITYLERYTLLALTGLATYDQEDDGKTGGADFITKDQLNQVVDYLSEINSADIQKKFLAYMKVTTLEEILASDFNKAIKALEAAKNRESRKVVK